MNEGMSVWMHGAFDLLLQAPDEVNHLASFCITLPLLIHVGVASVWAGEGGNERLDLLL